MRKPDTVGSYQVGPELGTWGSQSLFRGARTADGSRVLLATLRFEDRNDEGARQAHRRRVGLLSRLEAECLPRARDVVDDADGVPWVAFDRPSGVTLSQQIPEYGMSPEAACSVALCVVDALEDAHAAGLVHGYLSPENILLDNSEQASPRPVAVLLGVGGVAAGTSEPPVSGPSAQLAPEVRAGQPVSRASDVFLVGALLFEMLSGVPMSPELEEAELEGLLLARNASVPRLLARSLLRCVAKVPGERLDDLRELAEHLIPYVDTANAVNLARLPGRYVQTANDASELGSLPAWVLAQAPKPTADSACPESMLVDPAFPRAPQTPHMDSLFAEALRGDRQRRPWPTQVGPELSIAPAESRTAAVAVSAGAGLGAALAWLSALL